MYVIIEAVESMQNAVARSQAVNADTTVNTSEVLTAALKEANTELSGLVKAMSGLESASLTRAQAEYQQASQEWSSIETQLNANVQVAQDMTTRDSQHQQSLVQFASIVTGINSYLGNLLQSSY